MKFRESYFIQFLKFRFSTLIDGAISKQSKKFLSAEERSVELINLVNKVKIQFSDVGNENAIMRLRRMNKLTVTDRLNILFDKSKYTEINYYSGYHQIYGNIPKGGGITALGKISNTLCVVSASNPVIKGGAVYPITLRKQLRAQNLSLNLNLPFISIIDSAGAFLPLQSDIFPDKDHGGRAFYNQAILQSRGIPVISLVCGSCTAGAAYIPTMSTENVMVDKTSHIFLGGPPLVKAATGEVISADDLGGAVIHNKISGCSDYMHQKEKDSLLRIRDIVSTFPKQYYPENQGSSDPLYPSSDLNGLLLNYEQTSEDTRSTMKQILARILDSSCLHEYKSEYGTNLITGFGKINGHRVAILASHGSLSENDCLKASNFIQICGQRVIPIISFIHSAENQTTIDHNTNTDYNGSAVKSKSLLMRSMATRNCKLITVVIGDAIGVDYICLGGLSMNPDFIFAWPNSRFGWSASDLENSETSSALQVAGDLGFDDIVEPCNTRSVLSNYLHILQVKFDVCPQVQNQPVYRF